MRTNLVPKTIILSVSTTNREGAKSEGEPGLITAVALFRCVFKDCSYNWPHVRMHIASRISWGPFLERPSKLSGPVSYFEIEVSRKVGCVLTSNEVHFVSLAENFTV